MQYYVANASFMSCSVDHGSFLPPALLPWLLVSRPGKHAFVASAKACLYACYALLGSALRIPPSSSQVVCRLARVLFFFMATSTAETNTHHNTPLHAHRTKDAQNSSIRYRRSTPGHALF
jgi:hypothetical protein